MTDILELTNLLTKLTVGTLMMAIVQWHSFALMPDHIDSKPNL